MDLTGQKDRHVKYMRNKSWPQFEDWKEVFGKDRADVERGVDVAASAGQIYGQREDFAADDGSSQHMTLDELFPDVVFPSGVLPEMIDESQSVTEGGVSGTGSGARVGPGVSRGVATGAASGSSPGGRKKVPKKVIKKQKVVDDR